MRLDRWKYDRLRELVKLEHEMRADVDAALFDYEMHPEKKVALKRNWEWAARELSDWFDRHSGELFQRIEHD